MDLPGGFSLTDLILALIQGVTEIFPISSSGHQVITGALLGAPVTYTQALLYHAGTLAAIAVHFRQDALRLARGELGRATRRKFLLAFAATALVGLGVFLLSQGINSDQGWITSLMAVNGGFLLLVGLRPVGKGRIAELSPWQFVLIGLVQGISALPGISRLGWTLGAGLLLGLGWFEALTLSFLLSLPTIFFANLSILAFDAPLVSLSSAGWLTLSVVLLTSFAVSLWALKTLARYLGQQLLIYLGIYCLMTGIFFRFFLLPH